MEIIAVYKGYDDDYGMKFQRKNGLIVVICDGEMNLEVGAKYKIIAHEFDPGSYGDDLIVTDYDIEKLNKRNLK